jgi:hypothetical protein
MFTRASLAACLAKLEISQVEAAHLLSVDPRTFRRWIESPSEMPGPAAVALGAWLRLNALNLPWRPDGIELPGDSKEEIANQITLFRNHSIGLDAILERVRSRGGPTAPWRVELKRGRATLEHMTLHFYLHPNGSFSPSTYSRADKPPDWERDRSLLEDGIAAIADAIARLRQENDY